MQTTFQRIKFTEPSAPNRDVDPDEEAELAEAIRALASDGATVGDISEEEASRIVAETPDSPDGFFAAAERDRFQRLEEQLETCRRALRDAEREQSRAVEFAAEHDTPAAFAALEGADRVVRVARQRVESAERAFDRHLDKASNVLHQARRIRADRQFEEFSTALQRLSDAPPDLDKATQAGEALAEVIVAHAETLQNTEEMHEAHAACAASLGLGACAVVDVSTERWRRAAAQAFMRALGAHGIGPEALADFLGIRTSRNRDVLLDLMRTAQ